MLLGISSNDGVGPSHDFSYAMNNLIKLRIDSDGHTSPQIALKRIRVYNSWNNISAALGNNQIRYNNGVEWTVLTVPDGNYTLTDLFQWFEAQLTAAGDDPESLKLTFNRNTGKITLRLQNSYQLDMTHGTSPKIILGASTNITASTVFPNKADIFNGKDTVQLHTNIHSGSIFKNSRSDVIATFIPANFPNAYMDIEFSDTRFLDMNTFDLSNLYFRLTWEDNTEFNLEGSPVYYEFYLS